MSISTGIYKQMGHIDFIDKFDFHVHRDFKQAYTEMLGNPTIHEIEIGIQHLVALDSAALGMLVLLRERAAEVNKSIILANPSGYVCKLLEVANFDKLFQLVTAPNALFAQQCWPASCSAFPSMKYATGCVRNSSDAGQRSSMYAARPGEDRTLREGLQDYSAQ
jgi:anti-anti-sigma factor